MHFADIHACTHIMATDLKSGQFFGAVNCIDACITEYGICRGPDLKRIICEGVYDQDQVTG